MENTKFVTLCCIKTLCQNVTISTPSFPSRYRATTKQIFFFLLMRLQRHELNYCTYEDKLNGILDTEVIKWRDLVAQHLNESGESVTKLKEKDGHAWELLRIQIERSLHRKAGKYECIHKVDLIGDAYGNALLTIYSLLNSMVSHKEIEQVIDILDMFCSLTEEKRKGYDFRAPYFTYIDRIIHNELVTELRKETNQQKRFVSIDFVDTHMNSFPTLLEDFTLPEVTETLQHQIKKLLFAIQNDLPPKAEQVIMHTLAARPQFCEVLERLELDFREYHKFVGCTNDSEIALKLNISENSVRVHRNSGKKRIANIDPSLSFLLENLMARRG